MNIHVCGNWLLIRTKTKLLYLVENQNYVFNDVINNYFKKELSNKYESQGKDQKIHSLSLLKGKIVSAKFKNQTTKSTIESIELIRISVKSVNSIKSIISIKSTNRVKSFIWIESMNSINSISSINPTNLIHSINPMTSINSINSLVNSINGTYLFTWKPVEKISGCK